MTDAELFANLDLNQPELAAVKQADASRNIPGARAALAAHLRNRRAPMWILENQPPKPTPRDVPAAEKILRHQFDYTKGPNKAGTLDFGPKIDWTANPTEGEARTHLWNESLNRHFHFRTLADAYWRTGLDKYATYLLFDAGPVGYSHQHEDKLGFVLWSHGRQLILDPGNFSNDRSRWHWYVLSSAGHNTILVDDAGAEGQRCALA